MRGAVLTAMWQGLCLENIQKAATQEGLLWISSFINFKESESQSASASNEYSGVKINMGHTTACRSTKLYRRACQYPCLLFLEKVTVNMLRKVSDPDLRATVNRAVLNRLEQLGECMRAVSVQI